MIIVSCLWYLNFGFSLQQLFSGDKVLDLDSISTLETECFSFFSFFCFFGRGCVQTILKATGKGNEKNM